MIATVLLVTFREDDSSFSLNYFVIVRVRLYQRSQADAIAVRGYEVRFSLLPAPIEPFIRRQTLWRDGGHSDRSVSTGDRSVSVQRRWGALIALHSGKQDGGSGSGDLRFVHKKRISTQ